MNRSYVLKALGILGPEEILNLSQGMVVKQVAMKKAAGDDLVVWDDVPENRPKDHPPKEAKVLPFPKKKTFDESKSTEQHSAPKEPEGEPLNFLTTDVVLMQRELAREADEHLARAQAYQGYKKATDIFVVKSQNLEGQEKIRFASTEGILVNKKQA